MGEIRELDIGGQVAFGTVAGGGTTTVFVRNIDEQEVPGLVKVEPVGITKSTAEAFGYDYTEYERSVDRNALIQIQVRFAGALARVVNRGEAKLRVWTDA